MVGVLNPSDMGFNGSFKIASGEKLMIWTDSEGRTVLLDGESLTSSEIQKMRETASDMTAWSKTLDEIKASRGGHEPADMHRVIVKQKILDDVPWGKPDFGIGDGEK